MRYLGGKFRNAARIARVIGHNADTGKWWDSFCGGLSSATALASLSGPGIVSDANPALISLYNAVLGGWALPHGDAYTIKDWHAAKLLPETDPRKALLGFGGSYGAIWFSSPTLGVTKRWNRKQRYWCTDDPIGAAGRAIVRDLAILTKASCCAPLICADFVALPIEWAISRGITTIYCDPPYAGTTGYPGMPVFDHAAFWLKCVEYAAAGIRVFVSEYYCPPHIPHVEVWNRASGCMIAGAGSGLDRRADPIVLAEGAAPRVERLFEIG